MNRTRKWEFVAQEAQRLFDLRLSTQEIADRLEVNQSTVTRWIQQGKLVKSGRSEVATAAVEPASCEQSPEDWATTVRQAYDLDATDDQLVTLAESALLLARDPRTPAPLRLQATSTYQRLVKQLKLVARAADAEKPAEPAKRKVFEVPKRTGTDPRGILTGLP